MWGGEDGVWWCITYRHGWMRCEKEKKEEEEEDGGDENGSPALHASKPATLYRSIVVIV